MLSLVLLASFAGILKSILMFVFIVVCILLITVILLQEGKGGGLGGAFGGAGAETFGVQSGGVNKFTAWVAVLFCVIAIFYASFRAPRDDTSVTDVQEQSQPAEPPPPGGAVGPGADGAGDEDKKAGGEGEGG